MRDLLLVKTGLTEPNKLKVNRRFYQSLRIDGLVIEPFDRLTKEEINQVISLNKYYEEVGIKLVLRFDIKTLIAKLLGVEVQSISLSDPKIRKSLYHFLSFLIKHGLRAFDLLGLEEFGRGMSLIEALRELNKNTFFNRDILSLGEVDVSYKTLLALSSPNLSCLSLVRPRDKSKDLLKLSKDFEKVNAGLILSPKNFKKEEINFKNYPSSGKRLIFMTLFFLKSSLYIEERDLDFEDVKFLRELFSLKNEMKKFVKTSKILPKEKNILAFIREGEGEKLLFLANLIEKEVLVDLAFKLMDYKDYDFLLGSLTCRRLYRTIVLRPYEAIVFRKL